MKCTKLGPCKNQNNYYAKNDKYSLLGEVCTFCKADLAAIEDELEMEDASVAKLRIVN